MKEQPLTITLPPEQLYPLVQPLLYASTLMLPGESTFWTMGFDRAGHLLFVERLVTIRPIHLVPSTVFHTAVSLDAAHIVLCQQPANKILKPTEQDWVLVRRVMHIGLLLQIPLSDHLMIDARHFVSFTREGWLRSIAEELYQQKSSSTNPAPDKKVIVTS